MTGLPIPLDFCKQIKHSNGVEAHFEKNGPGHSMVGTPLCTGADCNVKASPAMAEIADSVNVTEIVTNGFSRNSVCTLVLVLTSQSAFHRRSSQLFPLINRNSPRPYLPLDWLAALCILLIACKVDS